jgi:hypothetical protein
MEGKRTQRLAPKCLMSTSRK